jgi:hypothetical protein
LAKAEEDEGVNVPPGIWRKTSAAGNDEIQMMHSPVIHVVLESGRRESNIQFSFSKNFLELASHQPIHMIGGKVSFTSVAMTDSSAARQGERQLQELQELHWLSYIDCAPFSDMTLKAAFCGFLRACGRNRVRAQSQAATTRD